MNNLDGQIFFATLCAVILAWLSGLFIAQKYRSNVLSFMQTGESPKDKASQAEPIIQSPLSLSDRLTFPLISQNAKAIWYYRILIVCISIALSLVITLFYLQDAFPNTPFSFRRSSLLFLAYGWSIIPSLGLLEHWSRARILVLSLLYSSIALVLIMLNSENNSSINSAAMWLYGQLIPPLAFILILTGPKIRTSGPYLLVVFFLLVCASLMGYQVLDQSLAKDNINSWLVDLVRLTNAYITFVLFGIVPWLIAFFPLRFLAKSTADLYHGKCFSEPQYILAGIWLIILLFHAMTLSHGLGMQAYTLLISWLMIPLLFYSMRPLLKPRHNPPTLLLLRVFREADDVGKLFDKVLERWRYSGNTVMIAGKDLALRTLEPDQLFSFINGHLKDQFISNSSQLQQAITSLDLEFDPDGRYRVNEFFCFDSTWKTTLDALISKTDLVLMDLRSFNSERKGCSYELSILANAPHLNKIIILFNPQTETNTANALLKDKTNEVLWIKDDPTKKNKIERDILMALLQ